MAALIYGLCATVAAICAALLLRAWRHSRHRLLFWTAMCFTALTTTNVLLFLDKVVFLDVDLALARSLVALVGMAVLLYGLVWDAQ